MSKLGAVAFILTLAAFIYLVCLIVGVGIPNVMQAQENVRIAEQELADAKADLRQSVHELGNDIDQLH